MNSLIKIFRLSKFNNRKFYSTCKKMNVCGKVALVTGGSKGIGYECTVELLKKNAAKVYFSDINCEEGQKVMKCICKEFGADRAMFIQADVTKKKDMENLFETVMSSCNCLDIVVNNAGIWNDVDWEREVATNINGVIRGSFLAFKYMSKEKGGNGGVIVNLSSILGLQEFPLMPVYTATKHAVIGFSRSLGDEVNFENSGIRVLSICPGVTLTDLIANGHITGRKKPIGAAVGEALKTLPSQPVSFAGVAIVHIIQYGESASVWVTEGREPVYEVTLPDRQNIRTRK